jgi:RNA polymerase sigma-70 factor (ECF subfamily)
MAERSLQESAQARSRPGVVHALPFSADDARLVESLRSGHPAAAAHFYDRFAGQVHRLLFRILGPDSELEDAVHDTFLRALSSIHKLRDPASLRSWLIGIAVFSARRRMQNRTRRRWLVLRAPEDIPDPPFSPRDPELSEALGATYAVLRAMPADEGIAVVLRLVERMTLLEAAHACGVSLSTFKRRLQRGEKVFRELAEKEPALQGWLSGDTDHGL